MNPMVAELVDRIQGGEKELITELWGKFRPLWTKWSKKTILCGYDSEDLQQQSYLILVEALKKFEKQQEIPFEGYYRMMLRSWRGNQLRKKTEQLLAEDENDTFECADETICVEQDVIINTLYQKAWAYIETLPLDQQILMRKFYLEDRSLGEVAASVKMTYKSAEAKKGRILRALKEQMS